MYAIKCTISGEEAVISKLNQVSRIPTAKLVQALNHWRFALSNEIAKSLTYGPLHVRRKDLYRSAADRSNLIVVEKDAKTVVVKFGKTLISYAYSHEFGGKDGSGYVESKGGGYLAIPLSGWRKTSKGTTAKPLPLGSYKLKGQAKTNTRIVPLKSGDGFMVLSNPRTKKESPVPLFILKKRIKVPKRQWFREAVERALPSFSKIVAQSRGEFFDY